MQAALRGPDLTQGAGAIIRLHMAIGVKHPHIHNVSIGIAPGHLHHQPVALLLFHQFTELAPYRLEAW